MAIGRKFVAAFFALTIIASMVEAGFHRSASAWPASIEQIRRALLNSKRANSESAQWEDLGWAWGKRSDPMLRERYMRTLRALNEVKKDPDWHDLGWAWGRK